MNIEQVVEEVAWYVLDAIKDTTAYDMSLLDRICMLKYYTGVDKQPIEEHYEKTIKQVFSVYQHLNPELDISISLVFDLHDFDIHGFIVKQARVYFNYPAEIS